MHSLLLRSQFYVHKSPSLQAFQAYREAEAHNPLQTSVSSDGELLEYETLELRVHPPNIDINNAHPTRSIITVDSANRPGTLIEVVQHFTELGLDVRKARISSDGGWFVDEFEVTDSCGKKVADYRKLNSIKQMLNINLRCNDELLHNADETDEMNRVETTVFELAGQDAAGLLADVTSLLTTNGCNVRSAAVWTYKHRVAFVLSVTENGMPVHDGVKLQRLQQLLFGMMDSEGDGIVDIKRVRGEVHHDRRLHQLMLQEDLKAWDRLQADAQVEPASDSDDDGPSSIDSRPAASPADSATSLHEFVSNKTENAISFYRSSKHSKPDVAITRCGNGGYWLVTIKCKDRNKLLFDTVCTLADMDYDVYHATIDSQKGLAHQEYYIKPRYGGTAWNAARAVKLAAMMESAIQRRFPKGLKVHVHSADRFGCLSSLARVLKDANLSVTRAKVKTYALSSSSGHTFCVMDASGAPPDRSKVEKACAQIGGKLVDAGEEEKTASAGTHKFSFSFLNRQWGKGWNGLAASPSSSDGGS
ncbi:hypothetical protein WJX84_010817 [Apatococcus fuscideae]|uniref:ACT domain-containing protein n=1 Tax=Apatococcus fuscideae TaxID=2026836 RepID=A0AAW1SUI1_9CHLO